MGSVELGGGAGREIRCLASDMSGYGEQVLEPALRRRQSQGATMHITRSSIDTQKGPAEWFTGDVYIDALAAPAGSSTFAVALVHFTPGARTAWHTHPHGQTIFVTEGVGLCQREGGPIEVLRPGDRVFFQPGENHWPAPPEALHGPRRHAAERRQRQPGDLGRARQRRAVRGRSARLTRRNALSLHCRHQVHA
jgi:quercetin dioxygenase-like cupin family protein